MEAPGRKCFKEQSVSVAAQRSSNIRTYKSQLNCVAMETTGDLGECRSRGTEGAVRGKERRLPARTRFSRGGFSNHLSSVSAYTVLYWKYSPVLEIVCVLKILWPNWGKKPWSHEAKNMQTSFSDFFFF